MQMEHIRIFFLVILSLHTSDVSSPESHFHTLKNLEYELHTEVS